MSLLPPDFHFLRPDWLYALIPAALLAAFAWHSAARGQDDWRGLVEAHLLRHLAVRESSARGKWPLVLLAVGWALAALAAAGPAWEKVPAPALEEVDPTVVVMSLAQSMNATDASPNRLTAGRHKVDDLLRRMRGGQAALVIFADAPFVAAPLTEDGRVIAQMLPELATDLMPVLNDRPDLAIRQGVDLLKNTGARSGRILLVTNGPGDVPERTVMAARAAASAGYHVSVLGIGGETALPMTGPDGRPLKARDGKPLMTRLDAAGLQEVAQAGNGRFERVTADGRDLDALLARPTLPAGQAPFQQSGLVADQWVDMGPWLVLGAAALAAFAFRRGLIAVLALTFAGALLAQPAHAQQGQDDPAAGLAWNELWRTPDQRGADAFAAQDYGTAATTFRDPSWQASSLYRGGDFERAASTYAAQQGADFNRGNALARAGKLKEAVAAYDAALAANPKDADAAFNRDLVLKALQKQNQQNQQDQNQGNDPQKQPEGGQDKDKQQDKDKGDQNKDAPKDPSKPDKPQDQKPNDQKPGEQQPPPKPDPAKQDPSKPDPKKPDPAKQDPAKQDPAKSDPAKPDPAKPDPAKQEPARPEPPKPEPAKPEPAKPDPASQNKAQQPPPPVAAQPAPAQPMSEQDQNREQTLRMVPDDPVGLLRARIRAHYTGILRPTVEEDR